VIIIFCTVPTEPTNVSVTRVVDSPTQLHVQWKEPEEHNGIIQAYTVYCRTNTIPETGIIVIYQVVLATQLETLVDLYDSFTYVLPLLSFPVLSSFMLIPSTTSHLWNQPCCVCRCSQQYVDAVLTLLHSFIKHDGSDIHTHTYIQTGSELDCCHQD